MIVVQDSESGRRKERRKWRGRWCGIIMEKIIGCVW